MNISIEFNVYNVKHNLQWTLFRFSLQNKAAEFLISALLILEKCPDANHFDTQRHYYFGKI